MSQLKQVSAGVFKHATGLWSKSLTANDKPSQATEENPTYPYIITDVDQVVPTKEHMESFESKRNQLDKQMPVGKKLETLSLFYNPTSEGLLKKILQSDWKETFLNNNGADQLTFYINANDAIQANDVPFYKLLICRVCLGREGLDFTQPHKGYYKVKDLTQISTSFLYTFRNSLLPYVPPPVESSPLKSSSSSVNSSPAKTTTTSTSTPSSPGGEGKLCQACTKINSLTSRFCTRCGNPIKQ
ncbi:hypothetical protein DLAC_01623 [Tieghemostelium lacteum]|uniref:Uncharacterized protein n=1 Tax=Tieghemostelium lacteum TaxID=361077 RepID=A0A152A5X6_TIELA|nr:hypothetical protein DLAC_01623 [Tieghemostelium lacteum]|eukprot:KYR01623.1 hypothetical protein DLAC_01623 [Tieghemostelium lacteum]